MGVGAVCCSIVAAAAAMLQLLQLGLLLLLLLHLVVPQWLHSLHGVRHDAEVIMSVILVVAAAASVA